MYCVFLNRVERDDLLENIKTSYYAFNMDKNHFCHIIAIVNPRSDFYRKLYFADAFVVHEEDLRETTQDRLYEFAMDMVEFKKDVGIRVSNDKDLSQDIISKKAVIDYCGVNCRIVPIKLKQPDIRTLSADDIAVIIEFFGEDNSKDAPKMYNVRNFLFKYSVENDGSVYYLSDTGKKKIADLNTDEFAEILAVNLDAEEKRRRIRKALEWYKSLDCFNDNYPDIFLLVDNDSIEEEIVKYKVNLFNAFKNIYPQDYIYLPPKVVELMVTHGYLPVDEIKAILGEGFSKRGRKEG